MTSRASVVCILAVLSAALLDDQRAAFVSAAGCPPVPAGYDFIQGVDGGSDLLCLRNYVATLYSVERMATACDSGPTCVAFQTDVYGFCLKNDSGPLQWAWPGVECYGYYARRGFPVVQWPPEPPGPPPSPPPELGSPASACPSFRDYTFLQGVGFKVSTYSGGVDPGGLSAAMTACDLLEYCSGFSSDATLADDDGKSSLPLTPRNASLGACQGFYNKDFLFRAPRRPPHPSTSPPQVPDSPTSPPTPAPPPPAASGTGTGGLPPWAIGAIVGSVVGAALLACLVTVVALAARARRRPRRGGKGPAVVEEMLMMQPSSVIEILLEAGSAGIMMTAVEGKQEPVSSEAGQVACSNSVDSFDMGDECKSLMMDMIAGPQGAMSNFKDLRSQLLKQSWRLQDDQLEMFEELGRGGSGTVYRAVWKGLAVAAKVMLLNEDMQSVMQRHMMEAVLSAALSHANIVHTYLFDLKPLEGGNGSNAVLGGYGGLAPPVVPWRATVMSKTWQLVILQELCTGGTLRDLMPANAGGVDDESGAVDALPLLPHLELMIDAQPLLPHLELPHLLQLALDVAQGLEHLHSKNIVHSDLTPSNILLQAAGSTPRPTGLHWVAKVADFGLSIAFEEGRTHVSHVFAGTLHYIAPETQASGVISKLSDVFTFGVLLSEMAGACVGAQEAHAHHATASLQAPPASTPTPPDASATSAASSAATPSGEAAPTAMPPAATPSILTTSATRLTTMVTQNIGLRSETRLGGNRLETVGTDGNRTGGPGNNGGRDDGGEWDGVDQRNVSSVPQVRPLLPRCIPPELAALVDGCLSPRPDQRPTITAVRQSLTSFMAFYAGPAALKSDLGVTED